MKKSAGIILAMDTKKRLGLRIKAIRKQKGLTQDQLAGLVNRSVDAISNLERGLSLPSFETLERFSEKLEVPIRDLFDFGGPEQSMEKERLLSQLQALARDMDEERLATAVKVMQVLYDGK